MSDPWDLDDPETVAEEEATEEFSWDFDGDEDEDPAVDEATPAPKAKEKPEPAPLTIAPDLVDVIKLDKRRAEAQERLEDLEAEITAGQRQKTREVQEEVADLKIFLEDVDRRKTWGSVDDAELADKIADLALAKEDADAEYLEAVEGGMEVMRPERFRRLTESYTAATEAYRAARGEERARESARAHDNFVSAAVAKALGEQGITEPASAQAKEIREQVEAEKAAAVQARRRELIDPTLQQSMRAQVNAAYAGQDTGEYVDPSDPLGARLERLEAGLKEKGIEQSAPSTAAERFARFLESRGDE